MVALLGSLNTAEDSKTTSGNRQQRGGSEVLSRFGQSGMRIRGLYLAGVGKAGLTATALVTPFSQDWTTAACWTGGSHPWLHISSPGTV